MTKILVVESHFIRLIPIVPGSLRHIPIFEGELFAVSVDSLIETAHQALHISRSAYLHLLYLIDDREEELEGKYGPLPLLPLKTN